MGLSLLERAIATVAPKAALNRHRARVMLEAARAYEGASRTDGWRVRRAGASANTDHMADARELRNRARSLVQNVPYCARALQVLVSATIGTGITPKAEGPDAARLDKLWLRWGDVADADGKSDIYGLMATAYRAMEQDGEVLIRRRTRRMGDGLPVPLQLQVLEIDWLDGNKNGSIRGGGQIINGIEYDVLGRIRNYWLFGAHPGEAVRGSVRLTSAPVAAADIIHLFSPVRPGQGRGITRFAPVIARVRDLMLYEDAELARKNLEARLGVIVSGDPDAMSNPDDDGPSQLSGDRESMTDLGPLPSGGVTRISDATGFQTIEPKPAGGYVEYCKYNAHIITAGIGVPYESATGDMREVNFSSARIRQMEFRRDTEQLQWLVLVPQMCKPIWRWFDEAAVLGGEIARVGSTADWSTPRWDYVNPKQDIDSEIAGMGAGLLSPSESLRRRGYDPEAVFTEMGKDYVRMEQTGALRLMSFLQSSAARSMPDPAPTTNEE